MVYEPEPGETVRVTGMTGRFKFVKYGHDAGGDYAVVYGGPAHHELERCVTVGRILPFSRKRRANRVRSV